MSKVMLISSDRHATARQEDYLDYLDPEIRTDFKEWLEGTGPAYVGINAHPDVDPAVNFDSELRLRDLETSGKSVADGAFNAAENGRENQR